MGNTINTETLKQLILQGKAKIDPATGKVVPMAAGGKVQNAADSQHPGIQLANTKVPKSFEDKAKAARAATGDQQNQFSQHALESLLHGTPDPFDLSSVLATTHELDLLKPQPVMDDPFKQQSLPWLHLPTMQLMQGPGLPGQNKQDSRVQSHTNVPNPHKAHAPHGLNDIQKFYGAVRFNDRGLVVEPPNYESQYMTQAQLPSSMKTYGGQRATSIRINKALKQSVETVMSEISKQYPDSYAQLFDGGGYFPKIKTKGHGPSMHSLGAAIDFNPDQYRQDKKLHKIEEMPDWFKPVIKTFLKHGWKWGGDFGDPMHFQFGTGY
jgi:hypothetical protein